ncbi:MAG: NAD(P)-binding protein [Pirellulales bacterium]
MVYSLDSLPPHLLERSRWFSPSPARPSGKYVMYWTHHALRTDENPALDVARYWARLLQVPLVVYQGIAESYPFASDRHHTFMLEGARDLQEQYRQLEIPYLFHLDRRSHRIPMLYEVAKQAAMIITEDFPLEPTRGWTERLASKMDCPILAVDTACVVPHRLVGKAFDRAYQYREATKQLYEERVGKRWPPWEVSLPQADLSNLLPTEVLEESLDLRRASLEELVCTCDIDHTVGPVADTRGGSKNGYRRWNAFLSSKLASYAKRRNQAEVDGVSRMSAYLHYGMVAPTRLARETYERCPHPSAEKYLDELLIWRELAFGFCAYREYYEGWDALPAWARATLDRHRKDARPQRSSWESCARGQSHEPLWNAAQRSLLVHGELHNNLRMTWGKALLDWAHDPEVALQRVVDLNHRYALDGRDPSSYGGILWCFGQFDRPFEPEQPRIGTVRPRPLQEHAKRLDLDAYSRMVNRPRFQTSPRIAMVGAGLGGLMASRLLQDHGFDICVFEKSGGFGGRSATRRVHGDLQFDHGAQYMTVRDCRLHKYLASWMEDGLIVPWMGRIGVWDQGKYQPEKKTIDRFVAVPGMNELGRHLGQDLRVHLRTRIVGTSMECCESRLQTSSSSSVGLYWLTDEHGERHGPFDIVLWNCPAPQLVTIVPDGCRWKPKSDEVRMRPCWTLMVALSQPWSLPCDGAFIHNSPLRWMARNNSKHGRPQQLDCWVAHSTDGWAEEHLLDDADHVTELLLQALRDACGIAMPEPIYRHSARWRFATPDPALESECLWDPSTRLGACGDWCHNSRIEGALLSGMSLAGRVLGWCHEHLKGIEPHVDSSPQQLSLFGP